MVVKRAYYNIKRFKLFIIFIAVFVLMPVLSASFFLEKTSNISETRAIEVEHAARVTTFATRIINDATSQKQMALSFAAEDELNSLMAFANRTLQIFSGRVTIENTGMLALISIQIPKNPFGEYINCRIYFSPSDKGLSLSKVVIGKIRIHGRIAIMFLRLALNIILGNGQGNDILSAVKAVSFKDKIAYVHFTPLPDIKFRFNMFKDRLKRIRDIVNPISDKALVRKYYLRLIETERKFEPGQKISLAEYLAPLFELANQRSKSGNHTQENKAAILALSIYAGHWRFEQFTGKVGTTQIRSNPLIRKNIVLAGRPDLRLHFIVSAGIKVIADSGVSFAAGEFKELMDAVYGGSGFSFADLAADRAGTHFARIAIINDNEAEKLQQAISSSSKETLFFPDISRLPEGISQVQFKRDFGNVKGDRYKSLVQTIDQQIMTLPLYR